MKLRRLLGRLLGDSPWSAQGESLKFDREKDFSLGLLGETTWPVLFLSIKRLKGIPTSFDIFHNWSEKDFSLGYHLKEAPRTQLANCSTYNLKWRQKHYLLPVPFRCRVCNFSSNWGIIRRRVWSTWQNFEFLAPPRQALIKAREPPYCNERLSPYRIEYLKLLIWPPDFSVFLIWAKESTTIVKGKGDGGSTRLSLREAGKKALRNPLIFIFSINRRWFHSKGKRSTLGSLIMRKEGESTKAYNEKKQRERKRN